MLPGDETVALRDTHGEADEIEVARLHRSRVLGHLTTDEGTAGLTTPLGHTLDELLDVVRIEPPHGDVVEKNSGSAP